MIGKRIKELREKRGLSQTDLAIKIGESKQTLYKYENDIITNIPSDKVVLIADVLNCSPGYLMGWEDIDGNKTPHGQLLDAYSNKERQEKANALYDKYESLPPEKQAQFDNFLKFLQSDSELPHLH